MSTKLNELINNAESGNIYRVTEGKNPYTNKKETFYITIIDKKDGFYWYVGIGENVKTGKVIHSNSFVWGRN